MNPVACFTCGTCGGTGKVIAKRHTEVLNVVDATMWFSTATIAIYTNIGACNAANILRKLLEMKLVERRGSGSRHSPYEWRRLEVSK